MKSKTRDSTRKRKPVAEDCPFCGQAFDSRPTLKRHQMHCKAPDNSSPVVVESQYFHLCKPRTPKDNMCSAIKVDADMVVAISDDEDECLPKKLAASKRKLQAPSTQRKDPEVGSANKKNAHKAKIRCGQVKGINRDAEENRRKKNKSSSVYEKGGPNIASAMQDSGHSDVRAKVKESGAPKENKTPTASNANSEDVKAAEKKGRPEPKSASTLISNENGKVVKEKRGPSLAHPKDAEQDDSGNGLDDEIVEELKSNRSQEGMDTDEEQEESIIRIKDDQQLLSSQFEEAPQVLKMNEFVSRAKKMGKGNPSKMKALEKVFIETGDINKKIAKAHNHLKDVAMLMEKIINSLIDIM